MRSATCGTPGVQDGPHDLAFTYDAAERLTQVAQADASGNPGTPVVTAFSYSTANGASNWKNGKLETATAYNPDLTGASVVETYTYGGVAGRVSARQTQVEGRTINQSFAWTDLGPIGTLGYPDDTALADPARPVSHGYSLGYLTSVGSFLTSLSYHANGMVHEALHANGMKDVFARDANDMPRPAQISVQRVSDGVVLGSWGPYGYDGSGNVKAIGADTFTYDLVSRLTTGTTTAGANRQCVEYNAFGALKALGTGTTTCTASPIAVDNATNRLSSPALYDGAGNLTNWGGYAYSWNRLNQMLTTTGTGINRSFGYTADGERILERNALDDTRTLWIRDLSGRVLREYGRTGGGTWSWSKDYVHRDGAVVSTVTASGTRHLHLDHLGSVRGASDTQVPPQPILPTVRDYYPFGLDALAGADAERMRFAGHERDTRATLSQTDDLDYMHARYYSPVVGRFLSVDPSRSFTIFGPQSFNLYTYVGNNPVGYVDPLGLRPEVIDGKVASDVVVVSDASQEDTAAEADRKRASAARAEASLRMMGLRSALGEASPRQRQILGDVYRMSNRPVNYIAGATGLVMIPVAGLTLAPEAALTSIGYDAAAVAPGLIDVGGFGFTELYYGELIGVGGRAFPALIAKMLMEGRGTAIGLLRHPEQTFRLWEYQINGQYYSLVMNPISRWVAHVGQSGGPWR
jgi:RHS repeat-associated protein